MIKLCEEFSKYYYKPVNSTFSQQIQIFFQSIIKIRMININHNLTSSKASWWLASAQQSRHLLLRWIVLRLIHCSPSRKIGTERFGCERGFRVSPCTIFPMVPRRSASWWWLRCCRLWCTCPESATWRPKFRRFVVLRWKVGCLLVILK